MTMTEVKALLKALNDAGIKLGISFTIYQEGHIYSLKLHRNSGTRTMIITRNIKELRGYMTGYIDAIEGGAAK